ncbi:hypothetical protein [Clostridioides difficile]|uniref:hypothetical protein n=1 Tax=Clostridioides difficile TaxID=1496 RepID=UPI000D1EB7D6|nr:hypothetical protein [Clostridioides difficile]HBE9444542.1 hypothetical protein [Clostridioides difficile]
MNDKFFKKENYLFYIFDDKNNEYSSYVAIRTDFIFISKVIIHDTELFFSIDLFSILFKFDLNNNLSITLIKKLILENEDKIAELIKDIYIYRKKYFNDALLEGNAVKAVNLHDKSDLFEQYSLMVNNFLENESKSFTTESLYQCGMYVYSQIEDGSCYIKLIDLIEKLLLNIKGNVMNNLNNQLINKLNKNNELLVYRGSGNKNLNGFSYTLSYETAFKFARPFDREKAIISKYKVNIKDVLMYITDRKEDEIVTKHAILLDRISLK